MGTEGEKGKHNVTWSHIGSHREKNRVPDLGPWILSYRP